MARDLSHVLEAIQAGVIVLGPEGDVEQLNAAACRILGVSAGVVGDPVERLLGPDHALGVLGRRTLASGASSSESEVAVERPFARTLVVDVSASPLFDPDGSPDGAVLVVRDRTLQRRLAQLEGERERYAAFGRIAAGIAHEIRNPLAGIRGAAELLARRSADEKTGETAELVVRESTRIAALLDDFMVFARGDDLKDEPLNVHELLDGVLDLLAYDPVSSRIQVVRAYDPSIPDLLGDANRLTQVFLNLARNALQAMQPDPGALTIRTRMRLDHRIAMASGPALPSVEILFRDDGPGMSEDVRRQATTPFFTTRSAGTGLGLAVAEYWVSRHGGSLTIDSTPGEGTGIEINLPLRRSG